jgi:hypothetical protein
MQVMQLQGREAENPIDKWKGPKGILLKDVYRKGGWAGRDSNNLHMGSPWGQYKGPAKR